ncbi:mediator of RNA polymerase II transcription subunit 28-like [Penaeus japonicus]|uniref:mediator of RNA polymerase II transcription subunit 28-like n=1 Tax=Penaeus japonicus TaxID=27405 RepID=UPI001C711D83|nr:mediator of RNA polymerase II transcription subunit 28-like [Penaeus japonicus]XP_042857957.1 mediator of RNA polymerase II transcription subunit 28-like [Penaeus japonicus]XP_042857958.1 mediator of RNA polymerase II transcription subunit 28-like [Penaeus japonicus]
MAATPTPGNLLDEFEEAFQNCMAPLTKEDNFNAVNQEELRTNAEVNGLRFLDLARQMEAFFLQKRYLLSVQKPELILLEDIIEMRNELARKEELLKKHGDKLNEWQGLLSSMQSRLGTSPSIGPRPPGPSGPTMHPGMMGTPSGSHNSVPMPGLSPVGSSMGPSTMGSSTMGPSGPSMPHNMNPGMGMPQSSMMQMGGGGGSMGPGPGMGGIGGMNQGGYQGGPGGAVYPGNMGQPPQGGPPGGLQGPLAYLEKTTTNIGMPEPRR